MSNAVYNTFIVIMGFCLLGLPIIFISLSVAPPTIDEFNSSIIIETIPGDPFSEEVIEIVSKINGSTEDIWEDIASYSQLDNINNISDLILDEEFFMSNYSIDVYTGFSKEIHLFLLEMKVVEIPSVEQAQATFTDLFSGSNGTILTYAEYQDDWSAFHKSDTDYPDVNQTISDIYTLYGVTSLEYMVTVSFFADIDVNGTQITTSFERFLLVDDSGIILFFLSNEVPWEVK